MTVHLKVLKTVVKTNFFRMNGHLIQYRYIDIKILHTEISSLTRIIHEKPASTGSRASFLKKQFPQKRPQNREQR